MSTLTKLIIGAGALLLLLCIVGGVFVAGSLGYFTARAVSVAPAQTGLAAARIADFNLPSGYVPEATVELAGYLFVSYAPGDGHSHIQFVQAPANAQVDRATLEGYIRQAAGDTSSRSAERSQVMGSREAAIRGQTVTLVEGEGINHDGERFRTLTGVFDGRGGPTLLSIESPTSSWNQQEVDRFIASIR